MLPISIAGMGSGFCEFHEFIIDAWNLVMQETESTVIIFIPFALFICSHYFLHSYSNIKIIHFKLSGLKKNSQYFAKLTIWLMENGSKVSIFCLSLNYKFCFFVNEQFYLLFPIQILIFPDNLKQLHEFIIKML